MRAVSAVAELLVIVIITIYGHGHCPTLVNNAYGSVNECFFSLLRKCNEIVTHSKLSR